MFLQVNNGLANGYLNRNTIDSGFASASDKWVAGGCKIAVPRGGKAVAVIRFRNIAALSKNLQRRLLLRRVVGAVADAHPARAGDCPCTGRSDSHPQALGKTNS